MFISKVFESGAVVLVSVKTYFVDEKNFLHSKYKIYF